MHNYEQLKQEFNRDIIKSIKIAKKEIGYNPTQFLRMFNNNGVELAIQLISKGIT